ncbi:transcriptional regulator, AraC family [Janthinobacterium sp. Marseille]|uniref:Helix-turn-helix transcriptional regulator n=1 Tax=Herminiimonas aquatilis TaxID=345342 RepID=A0ABW2J6J0_9BURK|nr:AraC family transcriptional regulator [Janthinobacterium sp. Marseille]ABR91544.1 transcriptional regulator, AraC family [Janthinobacterium sp. Marseille]
MNDKPILRISPSDLDNLLNALEVHFVRLSECLINPGWRLELGGVDSPAIHYNIQGHGRMIVGEHVIDLRPHTLVILPARQYFRIEVPSIDVGLVGMPIMEILDGRTMVFPPDAIRRYEAGTGEPELIMICGYFRALYGASMNLFSSLATPIVEQFDPSDQLDYKLKSALAELVAQEVGMGAMTATLLKQVLVLLLRRSLCSINLWVERFSVLSDPHIAHAFADMVTQPGAPHSVKSLAQKACLSRSAFMARFTNLFEQSPMAALREIRMRQAAILFSNESLSVDQVARIVGYDNRSSFFRAFRKTYGCSPSDYRVSENEAANSSVLTDEKAS